MRSVKKKVKMDDIRLNLNMDIDPYKTAEQLREIDKMAKRLQEEGQLEPIRLKQHNSYYTIENGHLRFYAARDLGWKEIDAIIIQNAKEW